jgi:His-Xaa-Ser system protein HxsD
MENIFHASHSGYELEMEIDLSLFPQNIVLRTAYIFLDKGYFFFAKSKNGNCIVRVTPKESTHWDAQKLLGEFSDELLSMTLRDTLERENKLIRETIVQKALGSMIDEANFVRPPAPTSTIDFDQDISEILAQIESDPDLRIDQDEIASILAEIETERVEQSKPKVNPTKAYDVKKQFQNR